MDAAVQNTLSSRGSKKELEVWRINKDHLDTVFQNDCTSRGKKVPVHPTLLNWAITFLACTSSSVHKEVGRLMKLPHISYVYWKNTEMILTMKDNAYTIHIQRRK